MKATWRKSQLRRPARAHARYSNDREFSTRQRAGKLPGVLKGNRKPIGKKVAQEKMKHSICETPMRANPTTALYLVQLYPTVLDDSAELLARAGIVFLFRHLRHIAACIAFATITACAESIPVPQCQNVRHSETEKGAQTPVHLNLGWSAPNEAERSRKNSMKINRSAASCHRSTFWREDKRPCGRNTTHPLSPTGPASPTLFTERFVTLSPPSGSILTK